MMRPKGILIVEDNLPSLKLLSDILTEAGYPIRPANNGMVAMEALLSEPPELILLDISMPVMDGFEFCRRVKALEFLHDIPILFISGSTNREERVKGFEVGAVDFISKPFQSDELLARVNTHLELSRLRRRLEVQVLQRTNDLASINKRLLQELEERKKAETKLRNLFNRYDAIISNSKDGFWIVDLDGRILEVNKAYLNMTGYSREEVLTKKIADLEGVENPEAVKKHIRKLLEKGSETFETRHRKKQGGLVDLEVTANYLEFENEKLLFAFLRDISARIEMEKRLAYSQRMEAVGTLAGGIAHDFNNILAIIMGNAELVQYGVGDLKANMTNVLKAVERGRELVLQLLTFSREKKKEEILFDPAPMVKEALKLMRSLLPSSVIVKESIIEGGGQVLWDPTQWHQVVMNLCTNARHAMGEKGGVLTVQMSRIYLNEEHAAQRLLEEGLYFELMVKDTGVGISLEVQEHIFEPFFTTKEIGGGTGLGLSVVYGAVKNCGGAVFVESAITQGSAFFVYLPIATQQVSRVEQTDPNAIRMSSGNVLFVDDELELVNVVASFLGVIGYTPTCLTNPKEALELFRNHPDRFDVVITDQVMPELSGDELAREIHQIRPERPIILCTGYSERINDETVAESVGFCTYLLKPFSMNALANSLYGVTLTS
ncbi:MAG: response regulator [Magnetococcales bacterium]|nr:response regulator [Magnetococcales bacterium]